MQAENIVIQLIYVITMLVFLACIVFHRGFCRLRHSSFQNGANALKTWNNWPQCQDIFFPRLYCWFLTQAKLSPLRHF